MYDVSKSELKKILKHFYNVTKFMIVLYNSDREVLYSYPKNICEFCKAVRQSKVLEAKCFECDNIGFNICDKTRKPYIYKCHMNVIEAISPIYANEVNIGYMMFGQIVEKSSDDVYEKAKTISKQFSIKLTDEMISQMPCADMEYINSAVSMMTMCASYLYTNELIRNNPDIFVYQLKQYIDAHLDADISIKTLCSHFYVSRSKLYKISKDNFDMGISDYIKNQRINKAKKLIENTDNTISQIAAQVGINDTNYFIRTFKNLQKVTPLKYRNDIRKSKQ